MSLEHDVTELGPVPVGREITDRIVMTPGDRLIVDNQMKAIAVNLLNRIEEVQAAHDHLMRTRREETDSFFASRMAPLEEAVRKSVAATWVAIGVGFAALAAGLTALVVR